MIQQTPWFERKFLFDFPLGLYPCILERLRGTPARAGIMTQGLSEKALTRKPDGKWSIQEHIGHLYDLEELHEGRIDDFRKRLKGLRPADLQNKKTEEAGHNSTSLAELLIKFRNSRTEFVKQLSSADDDTVGFASLHPRLKQSMRLVDMAFFVAEHDDHHYRTKSNGRY